MKKREIECCCHKNPFMILIHALIIALGVVGLWNHNTNYLIVAGVLVVSGIVIHHKKYSNTKKK